MFLSMLILQARHPTPTSPGSRSPKPTSGASHQIPAANPDKGTPLAVSPYPLPQLPIFSSHS